MIVKNVYAREIFNSRGIPTIECTIVLDSDIFVSSSVPSGTSRGMHEAFELQDQGPRLMGMGMRKAVTIINETIAPLCIGKEPNGKAIDMQMLQLDGTTNKTKLGANSMLAVSMAMYKAEAKNHAMPLYHCIASAADFNSVALPVPMFNLINGAMHAYNGLSIQEHMIVPLGVDSMHEIILIGATCNMVLKEIIRAKSRPLVYGDEGGIATRFTDTYEALDVLLQVIQEVEQLYNVSLKIALDAAASHFYDAHEDVYIWQKEYLSADALINIYAAIANRYPLYSLEDGLNEVDWIGWKRLHERIDDVTLIVGDDLCVTDSTRIAQAIQDDILDAVVIKPNQIGTVTEALQAVRLCKQHDVQIIVSHRSCETNDDFIADFAVGVSADHIKAGGFTGGEHMAKYNRLLQIEEELLTGMKY
ncbi:MAG TPA: phosphopyruvate hydratase [Candidatus Babeliales bacterium]|nr:phosphopyruvate hydratase [Candidatus Babeliales bacterium]